MPSLRGAATAVALGRPRDLHDRAGAGRRGGGQAPHRQRLEGARRDRRAGGAGPGERRRRRRPGRRPAGQGRLPPGAARAAPEGAAAVVRGLREPPRAPVAVARDRDPRRAGDRRPRGPLAPLRRPAARAAGRRPGRRAGAPLPAGARPVAPRSCSATGPMLTLPHAKRLWERAGELAQVGDEWVLAEDAELDAPAPDGRAAAPQPGPAGEREGPRGARSRRRRAQAHLEPARRPRDGRWSTARSRACGGRAKKGKRLVVELEPLRRLTGAERDALGAEAERIAPFRGATARCVGRRARGLHA